MNRYIDAHGATFGVEPICRVLQVAPSSYDAAKVRPPSARSVRDAELKLDIARMHAANFGVYGVRKLWRALRREGRATGRDRVGRLMAALGLAGVSRTRSIRTTQPAPVGGRPADLVERVFSAPAPNRLWVADLTYVWTVSGFCYTAFIVDAFSRRVWAGGWRRHCGQSWPSMPWRWRSGPAATTSLGSSTTAIEYVEAGCSWVS